MCAGVVGVALSAKMSNSVQVEHKCALVASDPKDAVSASKHLVKESGASILERLSCNCAPSIFCRGNHSFARKSIQKENIAVFGLERKSGSDANLWLT